MYRMEKLLLVLHMSHLVAVRVKREASLQNSQETLLKYPGSSAPASANIFTCEKTSSAAYRGQPLPSDRLFCKC